MNRTKAILAGLALAAAAPAAAHAQSTGQGWTLDVRGGALLYDDASAIETGGVVGLDALYHFSPRFAVGPLVDYAQTKTDGDFFVAVLDFGTDSSRINLVSQVVGALHYGLGAEFDVLPEARFSPYVAGGAGGYRLYLDPQAMEGPARVDGALLQAGGGIRWSLNESAGIRLEARDLIYLGYDREALNPVDPRHRNRQPDGTVLFPAAEADLPDARSTVHNFRLTVGFTYVPRSGR